MDYKNDGIEKGKGALKALSFLESWAIQKIL
jgi:hypothetical protein